MRPHGTQTELEKRRRRAIQLLKKGKTSLSAIARWLGASKSSVSRWYAGLSGERIQGAEIQDGSRASAKVATRAKRETKPALAGRSISLRISDRPVDLAAGCANNSEELWGSIPPQPCLEIAFGDGVELPETGTPGFGEKGRRDRPLEAVSLAAYKKTRKNLAPTCFFSMRAGFCSFRRSPARGLPGEKPPGCIIATRGTRFRRSVLWSCLRKGDGWLFLSSSGNGI